MLVLKNENLLKRDESAATISLLTVADPCSAERDARGRTWSEQEWESGLVRAVLANQPRRPRWRTVLRRLTGQ